VESRVDELWLTDVVSSVHGAEAMLGVGSRTTGTPTLAMQDVLSRPAPIAAGGGFEVFLPSRHSLNKSPTFPLTFSSQLRQS